MDRQKYSLLAIESSSTSEMKKIATDFLSRVWIESKKLWHIVGPDIINRLAGYSMTVITQAFAGHLGDVELASISIANNIIVGFGYGLLVYISNTYSLIYFVGYFTDRHCKYIQLAFFTLDVYMYICIKYIMIWVNYILLFVLIRFQ